MTYALLSLVFLAIAVAAAAVMVRRGRPVRALAICVGGACLLALTAVFDNLMIAAGLFTYADDRILGVRLGLVPIEDFAYPVAALILLPAIWAWLRRRDDR